MEAASSLKKVKTQPTMPLREVREWVIHPCRVEGVETQPLHTWLRGGGVPPHVKEWWLPSTPPVDFILFYFSLFGFFFLCLKNISKLFAFRKHFLDYQTIFLCGPIDNTFSNVAPTENTSQKLNQKHSY